MKPIVSLMIKSYNLKNRDWLNYKVYDVSYVTFHHIVKEEDGGKLEFSNGALLVKDSHTYLHFIESYDADIYNKLNEILLEINKSGQEPTSNQYKRIELLFLKFECLYANKIIKNKCSLTKKKTMATALRKKKQG